ncbi:MAG: general secretion pathway protein GspB [Piscinibacter sp.]|uniref:general secretion pathway protein GspB n=1 Tax=Piscinibacter sp. TaxID=1903157 RepID=UPI00258273A5|nr:general secretion pathway protein GspB [Piscinibacter sp.]MCW5662548.1 general secretion pathway protein GspB [Piscinibacter sp.]
MATAPAAPPAATLPALPPPTPVPVARAPAARAEPAAPRAAASAPAAEPRIPALRELPEELRRQIPPLNVGGSTWSANAASRFVILNGQLLRENDPVNPELTLRQIRQRSLVLEFRGQRFEFGF